MNPEPTRLAAGEIDALTARNRALRAEVDTLRARLRESEEILHAIQGGAVDAVVVGAPEQERVYTLTSADQPYRVLVEAMQEGAVTLGQDGTILYANQSFARMMRVPLQKVIGGSFERFVLAADASRFQAFLAQEVTVKAEMQLAAADGTEVPVYLSRSTADLAGLEATCMVVTDLTEQKRHEDMVVSERLARSILEQAAEAIIVCNAEGIITHASRQAEVLCGRPPLWQPFEAVFPLLHAPDGPAAFHGDGAAPGPVSPGDRAAAGQEVAFLRSDGRTFHLLLSGASLLGEGQKVLGTVLILTDITERRRAAQALRERERDLKTLNESLEDRVARRTAELSRANLALTQKNRELQDFAYVASHDLQEPLRKISSFSNLFRADYAGRVDENGLFYLQRIQDAANRMSDLIRDLLAFSRVVTHGKPFQEVDLGLLAAEVRTDLDLAIAETGATVEIETLPRIQADPYQIRQLLHHLISNALKFHRDGVAPIIRVRGSVAVQDGDDDEAREVALVEVEDNGIGFDEKYLDRIFTPFQRLHGRSQYAGTGMGLAISRRIVERHHGAITARSLPGAGTTFVVTLPVRPAKPA
jgi:PAS domain S-box-containing protein